MKKSVKVFAVVFALVMSVGFANAQVKEVEVYNTNQVDTYNRIKVVYHTPNSEYNFLKNKFELTSFGNQSIYLTPENMKVLSSELSRIYDKGKEWMNVAESNAIEKVDKRGEPTSFITNGGMIYDSRTFKSAEPTQATFGFERFRNYNYIKLSVFQQSQTKVYNAFFSLTFEITKDEVALKDFIEFLNNSIAKSEKIVSEDKMNLFK
jgi:hypothetical protein